MSNNSDQYRSTLSRAKGLGSAGDGVHHWWHQRVTAIILAPLAIWFVYSIISMTIGSNVNIALWMAKPFNALLLTIMLGALFYHARLGVQVVVEDYVHTAKTKIALLMLINITFLVAGVASIMAVGSLHFTS